MHVNKIFRHIINHYWGILALLIGWHLWVAINHYNPIVMPKPLAVIAAVVNAPEIFLKHASITLSVALVGLIGGMLIGAALAVATWSSKIASGMLTPVVVIFSSVPVITLIPIIARVFGYNLSTALAAVLILSFFPGFVFVSAGLRDLPPGSADLFAVLGANKLKTLLYLALPSAMPNLAIALRMASAQAILAAMVAEFLMGTSGLGYLFLVTKENFNTEMAFGASLVATVISVVMYLLSNAVEKRIRERWT
jgi:ABC-type nitrate/sulfonate/bicarbonate transport system permease component